MNKLFALAALSLALLTQTASAQGPSADYPAGHEFESYGDDSYVKDFTQKDLQELVRERADYNCKSRQAEKISAYKFKKEVEKTPAGEACQYGYRSSFCTKVPARTYVTRVVTANFRCL